jgi:hypothetical protein
MPQDIAANGVTLLICGWCLNAVYWFGGLVRDRLSIGSK